MNVAAGKKVLSFEKHQENGKKCFKVKEKVLHINIAGTPTTEIQLDYRGSGALVFIPLPGIFRPVGVNGSDQLFELNDTNGWTLKVRDVREIADRYDTDGSIDFHYAIFDQEERTFAVGNSPPDMVVGP